MKVAKILVDLNISLSTLNEEIKHLGLIPVNINDKLDNNDLIFLKEYFNSKEIHEIVHLRCLISQKYKKIRSSLIESNKTPSEMGVIEKQHLFNFIKKEYKDNILCPKVYEYNDDSFDSIYNWYSSWIKKTCEEQTKELSLAKKEIEKKQKRRYFQSQQVYDDESVIMSALMRGDGDLFGF